MSNTSLLLFYRESGVNTRWHGRGCTQVTGFEVIGSVAFRKCVQMDGDKGLICDVC